MKKEEYKISRPLGYISELISILHFGLLITLIVFTFGVLLSVFQWLWNYSVYRDFSDAYQGVAMGALLIKALSISAGYIGVTLAYVASSKLYLFFKAMRKGEFFSEANYKLLMSVGNISLSYAAVHLLFFIVSILVPFFIELDYGSGARFEIGNLFTSLLLGIVFHFFAEVVQRGYELQLDKDLTI